MSQAGAQREPSMEEILASIRRIIEDSDTVRKPDGSVAAKADPTVDADIDAFLEELSASNGNAAVPVAANESARPLEAGPAEAALNIAPGAESAAIAGIPVPAAPDVDAPAAAPVAFDEFAPVSQMPTPGTIQAPAPQAQHGAPVESAVRAIVSAETGRQVHAAFGELNQAFQRSRSMSLEQVAEEMVRPMLQDWLDNNLPTLVERLVREEIERVARGI
jgi:hypothetical protein